MNWAKIRRKIREVSKQKKKNDTGGQEIPILYTSGFGGKTEVGRIDIKKIGMILIVDVVYAVGGEMGFSLPQNWGRGGEDVRVSFGGCLQFSKRHRGRAREMPYRGKKAGESEGNLNTHSRRDEGIREQRCIISRGEAKGGGAGLVDGRVERTKLA